MLQDLKDITDKEIKDTLGIIDEDVASQKKDTKDEGVWFAYMDIKDNSVVKSKFMHLIKLHLNWLIGLKI